MIGIVDYGAGNLASVQNALEHLGHDASVCSDPDALQAFDRIILPGVGSFRVAMECLDGRGWSVRIREFVATGKPLLGICLGMQLLFDTGEEHGPRQGLGLIPGQVTALTPEGGLRIPHVGWNNLATIVPHPLLSGIKQQVDFYFVHSFHCVPDEDSAILATCDYGGEFVAVVARGNVAGAQFHPEKSQPSGLRLLDNFADWSPEC